MKLEFRMVQPNSLEWPQFIDMTYQYLSESWPDRVKCVAEAAFKTAYAELLRNRFAQGGRGLFLYFQDKKTIGFSNVYLSDENNEKVLNVAEFYVVPFCRRKGFATQMKNHLIEWGRQQSATKLKIEVDKNLERSNRFWSSFGFDLDSSGLRNIYFTRI